MSYKLYILMLAGTIIFSFYFLYIVRKSQTKVITRGACFLMIIIAIALVSASPVIFSAYSWFKGETGTSSAFLAGLTSALSICLLGLLYLKLINYRDRIEVLEKHVAILEQKNGNK